MSLARQPLTNDTDILIGARVSDDLSRANPASFPPEVLEQIAASKREGLRVVLVYWVTGECAVMPCLPGSDMPSPESVIQAYHGCRDAVRNAQGGVQ